MLPRIYKPGISEIDDACELLMARSPGESKRYILATKIVASGAISHTDATGWTVASTSPAGRKAQTRYQVTPQSCTCYDHQHTGMACKHITAMQIFIRTLANSLDAAMQPRHSLAQATAQGWKGMLDGLDPDDAAAAAEYAAAQPSDTRIRVLPGNASNRRDLIDRATGQGICTAQQNPNGAWRPCTAVDTVAWARWLGAQQQPAEVEVEAVPVLAPDSDGSELFVNAMPKFAEESPYKYDQRMALKGRAPLGQLMAQAAARRREAQAGR